MEENEPRYQNVELFNQGSNSGISIALEPFEHANQLKYEKFKVSKARLLFSTETDWIENKFKYFSKTTLNNVFNTDSKELYFEVEIFCNMATRYLNFSNIEDIKSSLSKHFRIDHSELISTITANNLPDIIILLFLNNRESFCFGVNNIGYFLLHAAMKLKSLQNPVKCNPLEKLIFYRVGYLDKGSIAELINSITIRQFTTLCPVSGSYFIAVTTDYEEALCALDKMEWANCIFEIHFISHSDTLFDVFTVGDICDKDIYFISTFEPFILDKLIKYENNKYKVILQINKDKKAIFKRSNELLINDDFNLKATLPMAMKNKKLKSVNIEADINRADLNLITESIMMKRISPLVIKFSNYDLFGEENIEYLTQLFYNNKNLRSIIGERPIYKSLLTSFGIERFYQALLYNKTLTLLDLSNNNIGDEGSKFISLMIRNCKSLRVLFLRNNNIGNEGIKLIAEALKTNNNINQINLDFCNINDSSLAYICEMIRVNDTLNTLILDHNSITDEGLKMFADALAINYSLISVEMEDNVFTSEGANYLVDTLDPNLPGRYGGSRTVVLGSRNFFNQMDEKVRIKNLSIIAIRNVYVNESN
jgi:hypothetical protein